MKTSKHTVAVTSRVPIDIYRTVYFIHFMFTKQHYVALQYVDFLHYFLISQL